ncbi:NACHT domain-containing protein [Paractinoplanes rishiriensis]|uniref:ATP-binding protein n=1 Tax=Paractinoplanes rishiriensis TaxID=1050105 RepID=A0A919KBY8_9ACTN|nr:NACHT domain-containing protein [Actinoplanes rishiriensis]GIF00662.1 ATP-binding protein [Actinoplanes rishiriensis]
MAVETLLLRVASTIATVGGKALVAGRRSRAERRMTLVELAGARGLGLLPQRRLHRQLEQLAETIADRLAPIAEAELAAMPTAERNLVLEGVADALEATEFTDEVLFETNLDEAALVRLTAPAAGEVLARLALSEAGTAFFHRLIREAVAHLTEVVVTLPSFHQRSLRELLARDNDIIGLLRQVLEQMPRHAALAGGDTPAELEIDYRREIIRKFDRVELFGVTVAGPTRRYPLDVAYLGLPLSGKSVAEQRHVYIRGDAGSGKTTLLRWLALKCARGEHDGALAAWNRTLPIMVELRRFAERDLPGPSEYLSGLSRSLIERLSGPWVHELLRTGRAVLLIDGVDEFPADRRPELHAWIADLAHDYPQARMVVTSRPAATPADWLAGLDFAPSDLQPMSRPHIIAFVRHWHAAIALELSGQKTAEEITAFRYAMIAAIDRSRPLRMMATNPLLCALLCALNWDRRTQLPQRRIEIYRAALEMLLRRRDHERQLSPRVDIALEYDHRLAILQDLAYWFTLNGWTDVGSGRLRSKLTAILDSMPQLKVNTDEVYAYLMTRSGVLREPVPGRIDFIHKTFQEYLAAVRLVEQDAIDSLFRYAERDDYHEVIVMAAGCARQHEAERLITRLLDLAGRPRLTRARRARLRLLAVSCSEVTSRISREVAGRILHNLGELVPPTTPGAARVLAGLGEEILPILPDGSRDLPPAAAAATLNTAALVGGPAALRLIATFRADRRAAVHRERLAAWSYFDPSEFAREAFGPNPDGWRITIQDPLLLPGVRHIGDLGAVRCEFTGAVPAEGLAELPRLESLTLRANRDGLPLGFLARAAGLTGLVLEQCTSLRDFETISVCRKLRHLALRECGLVIPRTFFRRLTELRALAVEGEIVDPGNLLQGLAHLQRLELSAVSSHFHSFGQLGVQSPLAALKLARCPGLRRLEGLAGLPLRAVSIVGCPNLESLEWVGTLRGLRTLQVRNLDHLDDFRFLGELSALETLTLESCGAGRLAFLRGAPRLRELTIVNTSDIPDLATLESLPELRRVRVDLRKHLGPDADSYIAALHRRGVEVTTDEDAESAVDPGDYDQWYQLDY